jgi:broad specificity phosphatase PhoE
MSTIFYYNDAIKNLSKNMKMNKNLFLIRHGQAEHNVRFNYIGSAAYNEKQDTRLTLIGKQQATTLGKEWDKKYHVDLVIVSPLSRALETASKIFKDMNIPMICLDSLAEYPQHSELCNKKRNKYELQKEFPLVDFIRITNESIKWDPKKKESINELNDRIDFIKKWLFWRKEKNIAIVSHSSYLAQFMHGKITNEDNELKHCYPYTGKISYNRFSNEVQQTNYI